MEKTQITQCPKCDTTFKVTPAQLTIAKGAVRCGACLHVFRASDHFQKDKEDISSHDDRTQDMFTESLFETSAEESGFDDIFDELDTGDNNGLIQDNDDGLIHDNMENEDNLIHDNMFTPQNHSGAEISAEFLSINADKKEDPFFNDLEKRQESDQVEGSDDESWAQDLLNDNDSDDEFVEIPQPTSPIIAKVSQQAFSYIEVDPLDLSLPEKRSRAKLWLGGFSCVLLLTTLAIQLAYFNFDQWAREEGMRPWYQLACEQLACTLPSTYDLSKIQTTASPQVSSHGKYQNALSVDVLFMNHATYRQAFPRLELTFSDHNDKPIAHRLFTPAEYLAGEASGLKLMPISTPIHIALEIRDPGSRANNYSVRFLAP
jgi:predicted Zn finger-like uncharacterized protein